MASYWTKKLEQQAVQSFVGRAQEIEFFDSLLTAAAPEYLMVHLFGVGGVGKTTLLDRVESTAKKRQIVVGRVNEAQHSIPDILEKFHLDFKRQGQRLDEFARLFALFTRMRLELQSDPQFAVAIRENSGRVFSAQAGGGGSAGDSDLPAAGKASQSARWRYLAELHQILSRRFDEGELRTLCFNLKIDYDSLSGEGKVNRARELLSYLDRRESIAQLVEAGRQLRPDIPWSSLPEWGRHQPAGIPPIGGAEDGFRFLDDLYRKVDDSQSRELLLNADYVLTQAFVRDIVQLTHDRRIVLMFDTYEFLSSFADGWLREAFLQRNIDSLGSNLTLICSERERLPGEWQPLLPIVKQIELTPFSSREAEEFLLNRGITDPRAIQTIQDLSGNLPLMLVLLSTEPAVKVDELSATQNVIERFLKWVPEQESVKREAVIACAFPRFFDEGLIGSLLPGADGKELFAWLCRFSFTTGHTGRWRYHSIVRRLMIQHRFDQAPEQYLELHRRLVAYYEVRLAGLDWMKQKDRDYQQLQALELEWLYHRLCQNQGFDTFVTLFLSAFRRSSYAQELVNTFMEVHEDLRGRSSLHEWYELFRQVPQCRDALDCSLPDWIPLFERLAEYEGLSDSTLRAFVHYELGYFYVSQRRYLTAERAYHRAMELQPDYVSAFNGLGTVYRLTERFEQAEQLYRRCLALAPTYIFPYYNLARLLHRVGRDDEAEEFYQQAIELRPNLPATYFNYGNFLQSGGRDQMAAAVYRQALEMAPHHISSHINLGLVLQKTGQPAQAEAAFRQALAIAPNSYLAYLNLGLLQAQTARPEEALASLRRCVEIEPARPDAYIPLAGLLEALGREREALGLYRQATQLLPASRALRYVTAALLERLGRYEEAIGCLEEYLRLVPDDGELQGQIAYLKTRL
ncbi:MAG: tetratricopeptide repeat protein [Kouleothrix sp.]|nr:tetratricopeptide repeat protein [Kouleothrix sp.]